MYSLQTGKVRGPSSSMGVPCMQGQRHINVCYTTKSSTCSCNCTKSPASVRLLHNAFKGEGRTTAQPLHLPQLRIQHRSSTSRSTTCMAMKVTGYIKLALNAGKANPAPPVGPALGSKGVNIMGFCKEYNAATQDKAGTVIPVEITVYEDRSFTFVLKTPPASVLLKQAANVPSGSGEPNSKTVGQISRQQLKEIAETKLPDLNCVKIEAAMNIVAGTAKNMGIKIAEE